MLQIAVRFDHYHFYCSVLEHNIYVHADESKTHDALRRRKIIVHRGGRDFASSAMCTQTTTRYHILYLYYNVIFFVRSFPRPISRKPRVTARPTRIRHYNRNNDVFTYAVYVHL